MRRYSVVIGRGVSMVWDPKEKTLVFGIYQRNWKIITFAVSDRKQHDTLIPLIKIDTKKGSLYYTDKHIAYYATLSNWKTPDNCSWNGRRICTWRYYYSYQWYWRILELVKTWLYHYRGVPRQYFHLYLKQIEFRFNHRNEDLFQILANIVVKAVPKS